MTLLSINHQSSMKQIKQILFMFISDLFNIVSYLLSLCLIPLSYFTKLIRIITTHKHKQCLKGYIAIVDYEYGMENLITSLIDRNIHIILLTNSCSIDKNSLFFAHNIQPYNKYCQNQKSTSILHVMNRSDIYDYNIIDHVKKIKDNINVDVDINVANASILILTCDKIDNKHYEQTSIILRQVLPDMITQMYGRIIYIDSNNDFDKDNNHNQNQNHNQNHNQNINEKSKFDKTGLNILPSKDTHNELIKHNVKIIHVTKSETTNQYFKYKLLGECVGRCLDYDLSHEYY